MWQVVNDLQSSRWVRLLVRLPHRRDVPPAASLRHVCVAEVLPLRGPEASIRVPQPALELRQIRALLGMAEKMIGGRTGDQILKLLEIREERRCTDARMATEIVIERRTRGLS